jgi:hypothetical protein
LTVPAPEPLAPELTVIHVTVLVAVQLHIDGREKLKDCPVTPPCGELALAGLRVGAQDISSLVTSLPPA